MTTKKKTKADKKNQRLQRGARIMAIVMIGIMVVFTVIMGLAPLLD